MITKALVENFRILYEENNDRLNDWSSKLLEELDPYDWVQIISERSYVVREIFAENEELLDELWDRTPGDLEDLEAELLYDLVTGLYNDHHHDFFIISWVGETILPFFEELDDPEILLSLYHILGEEYERFYHLVRDSKGIGTAATYFNKAIALKRRYEEIATPEIRLYLFEDYKRLLDLLDASDETLCRKKLELYLDAHEFAQSPEASMDYDAEMERLLNLMDETILEITEYRNLLRPEQQPQIDSLLEQIENRIIASGAEDTVSGFRVLQLVRRIRGEITPEELLEQLVSFMDTNIPDPDYSSTNAAQTMRRITDLFDYAKACVKTLGDPYLPDSARTAYRDRFFPRVMNIITGIPYLFRTDSMHSLCAEWYTLAEPYVEGETAKVAFLMRMIIRRQPITYIHSKMVGEISSIYAKEVIEKHPECFFGIRGCRTAEDVRNKSEELISFVRACGLLHDVGKCFIAEIVSRQNRSLSDSEFDMIRRHPELGLKAIGDTPEMLQYRDVILGHHKNYDGKHGYPVKFDNTLSPIKFVIDLITIADSTDAATDVLGRTYTTGKGFSKFLEELREGAGQRYNPTIVEMIGENEELQKELSELTTDGRYNIYYRSYQEIVKNGEYI